MCQHPRNQPRTRLSHARLPHGQQPHDQQPRIQQRSDSPDATTLTDASLTSRELGRLGEEHAAAWLENRGWSVVDRNWRTRFGELDVIALDPDSRLVFIEVKTRRSTLQGVPAEAVTPAKRLHLRRAAAQWLTSSPRGRIRHREVRFDVIAIDASGPSPVVRHIEGAF